MKRLMLIAMLAALLTGCSDNPAKEAAIEDRGVKAVPVAPVEKSAEKANPPSAAAAQPADLAKPEAAKPEVVKAVVQPAKPGENSETRAIGQTMIETKPIDGAKSTADAKAAASEQAKPVLDPKDPKSPLAERKVLFDYDSFAIRDEYRTLLENHAQYLKDNKQVKVILQGNTDERGSPEYNIALGQRRAEAVMQALSLLGVPDSQMEAVSFGEEKPIAEGHDETAWSQNRRTEIAYPNE